MSASVRKRPKLNHKQHVVTGKKRLMQRSKSDRDLITSSASASKIGGTVMPSAFAVLTLMTSSNLVELLERHFGNIGAFTAAGQEHSYRLYSNEIHKQPS